MFRITYQANYVTPIVGATFKRITKHLDPEILKPLELADC